MATSFSGMGDSRGNAHLRLRARDRPPTARDQIGLTAVNTGFFSAAPWPRPAPDDGRPLPDAPRAGAAGRPGQQPAASTPPGAGEQPAHAPRTRRRVVPRLRLPFAGAATAIRPSPRRRRRSPRLARLVCERIVGAGRGAVNRARAGSGGSTGRTRAEGCGRSGRRLPGVDQGGSEKSSAPELWLRSRSGEVAAGHVQAQAVPGEVNPPPGGGGSGSLDGARGRPARPPAR